MECSFQVRGDARVEKRKEKMWEGRGKRVSRSSISGTVRETDREGWWDPIEVSGWYGKR